MEIYTSRFFNYDLLSSGVVVPVRVSMLAPEELLGELSYELKYSVRALQPEWNMIGEWKKFSIGFWRKLDRVGVETIARQLAAISRQRAGKPLALLCYEDVTPTRGHRCHRTVFSYWWEAQTGIEVPELTDDGELLRLHQLHRQVMPMRPK